MDGRREFLKGLSAVGLWIGGTSTSFSAPVVSSLVDAVRSSRFVHSVGLFRSLKRGDIPPDAEIFLSKGFRTPGKGIALYAAEDGGQELSVRGRQLLEEAARLGPQAREDARRALVALERNWRIQAADGRWFSLVGPHESDMFGTLGDGEFADLANGTTIAKGTPCAAACQAYIDYCTYFAGEPLRWSAGIHFIEDVLHVGYGDTFRQTVMTGAGARFMAEPGFSGTAFVSNRRDCPVFNFAGQRNASLSGVSIAGPFASRRRAAGLGSVERWSGPSPLSNGHHDIEPEAWDLPGTRSSPDDRYAPLAGILVDGYAGSKPRSALPPPHYPAWLPSLSPWSGAALSSSIIFDEISISGFTVGLGVGTSNNPSQGDFVQFHRGQISDCKWGISVGNHQSRNIAVRDSRIATCWVAFTNAAHGAQAGRFGGVIENVAFGEVINLFDFNAYAGPLKFVACYGEAVWRLGWYTGGNGFSPSLGFENCQFSFLEVNRQRGVAGRLLSDRLNPTRGGAGNVDFIGTTLVVQSVAVLGKSVAGTLLIQAEDRAAGVPGVADRWRGKAGNILGGGLVIPDLGSENAVLTVRSAQIDINNGASVPQQSIPCNPLREIEASVYDDGRCAGARTSSPGDIVARSVHVRGASGNRREWEVDLDLVDEQFRKPGTVIVDDETGTVGFVRLSPSAGKFMVELQNNYRGEEDRRELIEPIEWAKTSFIAIAAKT